MSSNNFCFCRNGKEISIPQNDIFYIYAHEVGAFMIFANKQKMFMPYALKQLEQMLNPHLFVRVHHSFLIHKASIERVHFNHDSFIVMKNGDIVPLARRKKNEFKAQFVRL